MRYSCQFLRKKMIFMKILYFELRKEFIRKSFFLILIIMVVANFFWLEWDYYTNSGFTEDYVKVNASDKENQYYEELHHFLDGKLNSEKVSYVSEEYQKYHNLVSGDYRTEYDSNMHTGYVFGDYSRLTVHFYNPIKYLISYKEQNEELLEKAEENVRFFTEKNNQYEVEKNSYILDHYQGRNPLVFYETGGWKHLFSYDKSDLFILVLLIIGIIPTFSKEKKNAMEIIQKTSIRGRIMYIPSKLFAHIVAAVSLEVLFAIINYAMIHMQYGLSESEMMLYSISEYRFSPFNISMLEFYLVMVLSKCVGFAIIAVILTMIVRLVKNTYASFIGMIGYVFGFLYLSGFSSGITLRENALTLISPFSLLKFGEITMSLKEVNFCGHFLTMYTCLYAVQTVITATLLIILFRVEKKGKVIL